MWQKIASEMRIPWRSAESMHWQLGEQEMSTHANAPVFQLHPSAAGTDIPSPPSGRPVMPHFTPANIPQTQNPQYYPQPHAPHLHH
ncbi:uncharacterized protein BDZ99DRAFT_466691 [Mytilinidion resinicola]|uniref:Uncharacterized protein n=1 Tax=Mytilinidion resinicola TaxID=574789 RepID=A0A6A6YAD6_9PEZI|nr:uncharacterized protein BDZ99DRAFT_466691 [Mytilinidion resinicola]KAF2805781.1 hypothetical protein BDZ99DRAFT_466691 [Mytilinidion resinicola]